MPLINVTTVASENQKCSPAQKIPFCSQVHKITAAVPLDFSPNHHWQELIEMFLRKSLSINSLMLNIPPPVIMNGEILTQNLPCTKLSSYHSCQRWGPFLATNFDSNNDFKIILESSFVISSMCFKDFVFNKDTRGLIQYKDSILPV